MSEERKKKYVNQELLQKQITMVTQASYWSASLVTLIIFVCYFVLDVKEYLHTVLLPICAGIIINVWFFKIHKTLFYTYLIMFFLSLSGILSISAITGGIDSPFAFIIIVLPLGAFVTSRKQGRYWIGISVVSLIALYILSIKVELPNIITENYRHEFAFIINLFVVIIVSVISSLLAKFSYNAYRSKDEITQKNMIIEEKNTQIMDSIMYAKRIQDAGLPTKEYLNNIFKDYFIYYKPKDIVSGDFYWVHHFKETNTTIWVTADCTGHGVPGAFMSLIGTLLLNDMVVGKKMTNPKAIAELLSEWITMFLGQQNQQDEAETKDGMDLMICTLDNNSNKLLACGAYNPLYVVRNGDLNEYEGARRAIGYNHKKKKEEPFILHEIELQKGDLLYTFTDGYIDQKGGGNNKKFFSKRFKQLIEEISAKPLKEQESILASTMDEWKKNVLQMDDMLIFAVKID